MKTPRVRQPTAATSEPPAAAGAPLDLGLYTTLQRIAAGEDRRLILSLGGGSVPGLCGNLALLQILEELGLTAHVDEVWGTSAGAVIGGGWVTGTPAREILALVASLDRPGAIDVSWLRISLAMLLKPFGGSIPDGLIGGKRFVATIDAGLRKKTFEECEIPFRCIATSDDGQARLKIFRRGLLLPAICASMSLPGVFVPFRDQGDADGYYDGGLVEKTPLISPIAEHTRRGDSRRLLILATHFGNEARRMPARGFIDRFLQSIYAVEDQVWAYQLAEARQKPHVELMLLNPRIENPHIFDFSCVERDYLHARGAFSDCLQNGKLALTFGLS